MTLGVHLLRSRPIVGSPNFLVKVFTKSGLDGFKGIVLFIVISGVVDLDVAEGIVRRASVEIINFFGFWVNGFNLELRVLIGVDFVGIIEFVGVI